MKFSYEVVSVDTESKMMEVRFTAENEDPVVISLDIPEEGMDIRQHLSSYAPVYHWERKTKTLQDVAVGARGDIWSEHVTMTPEEHEAEKLAAEAAAE
jgi:hypothetical protein